MRVASTVAVLIGSTLLMPIAFARTFEPAGSSGIQQSSADSPTPARPSFAEWLEGIRAEAVARGIRQDVIDESLGHIAEPLPVVIARDRSQAETVLPLESYIARRLTPAVIRTGRQMLEQHRSVLASVEEKYGVPRGIILAIWGIESNFGRFSGIRPTVAALATLAWDPRRSALFTAELFDALEILNRGDIEFAKMRGSWAGAMGQTQFMPSSYLQFAEDFDGDGRRDIWASPADVFASIANYLKGHGWSREIGWGREVKLSNDAEHRVASDVARRQGSCNATRDMTISQPMAAWRELGVTTSSGRALPSSASDAALVSGSKRHFLVSSNYDALLAYNCAHAYAISVGLLADRIASTPVSPPATPKRIPKRSPKRTA